MCWIQTDRGQYRHHFAFEIVMQPDLLGLGPVAACQKSNAVFSQLRQNDAVEQLVLCVDQFMRRVSEFTQGVNWCLFFGMGGFVAGLNPFLEFRNAHFKQLVKIAGDDTQKAQALQQWNRIIDGLRKDSSIESNQAHFPGQEGAGGKCWLAHGSPRYIGSRG